MNRRPQEDRQSRAFYELSALILNILRSPPTTMEFSDRSPPLTSSGRSSQQITPVGFASMLFGISLALMLCGSVTFFIGFILMPWVLGLFVLFYFVALVSSLSVLGRRAFLSSNTTTSPHVPGQPGNFCEDGKMVWSCKGISSSTNVVFTGDCF